MIYGTPTIQTNGLVMCLDAANTKSYPKSGNTWNDLSGNNTTGSLTNGPIYDISNGGAFVFNGSTQNINLGSNNSLSNITFSSSGTWCVWINPTRVSQVIFGISDNNVTGVGYIVGLNPSGNPFITEIKDSSNGAYTAPTIVPTNTWSYLAISYELSVGISIYLNGNKIGTGALSGAGPKRSDIGQPFFLGYNSYAGNTGATNNYYQGQIAQFQVYKRILSNAEVFQNYNAIKSRFNLN